MTKETFHGPLERVDDCCWRIPKSYKPGMRVDGLIFADERLLDQVKKDQAPEQVANVAFLPGIQHASLAMPDITGATASASAASAPPIRMKAASSPPAGSVTISTALLRKRRSFPNSVISGASAIWLIAGKLRSWSVLTWLCLTGIRRKSTTGLAKDRELVCFA